MAVEVTAVIPTLNEDNQIEGCLESIGWVDEIIIIDGGSEDRTLEIANQYADLILEDSKSELEGFDDVRNKAIERASSEWILRIDADELIPEKLAEKLEKLAEEDEFDIIEAPRLNHFFGEEVVSRGGWPDYQKVLFRKGAMNFSKEPHNVYNVGDDSRLYRIEKSKAYAVRHFSHVGVEDWINSMNRYTSIEAKNKSIKPSVILAPLKKFFESLFYGKGILSRKGRILSVLDAEYVLNRELKKAQLKYFGSDKEIEEKYSDMKDDVLDDLI
jgi:glycosyltransferase involved in cell wall biosynthesis